MDDRNIWPIFVALPVGRDEFGYPKAAILAEIGIELFRPSAAGLEEARYVWTGR